MFVQLDNFFRSASETGGLIIITTTCLLIIYLLFKLTYFIERIIQRTSKQDVDVAINNKEIHINVGQKTIEIHSKKLDRLFWLLMALGYIVGIVYALSNFFFVVGIILLIILLIFAPKKILNIFGFILRTGVKGVLRIGSPK
ncbi:hypothetical protein [Shimazuella kribbensis]|uniref:hypothetical protein n=1 Tax=Shimazuella kribbensis TaxID=139808 RepID=UPI00048EB726|nr:hypothetical protein [Shimazuella kribbensis]